MSNSRTALRDAIVTALEWYLGPEADLQWFTVYAATFPRDIEQGLHVLHTGGERALETYLEGF